MPTNIPSGWTRVELPPPKPPTRKERLRLEALYKREDAECLANGEFGDYSERERMV